MGKKSEGMCGETASCVSEMKRTHEKQMAVVSPFRKGIRRNYGTHRVGGM